MTKNGKQILINEIAEKLKQYVKNIFIVGSYARHENKINDLDIVTLRPFKDILYELNNHFANIKLINHGENYMSLKLDKVKVDFWRAEDKQELQAMKIMRTIDKGHNIGYRQIAKNEELKLNDKGLFDENGDRIVFKNEKQLREILGIE